jgi:hypothetical protein
MAQLQATPAKAGEGSRLFLVGRLAAIGHGHAKTSDNERVIIDRRGETAADTFEELDRDAPSDRGEAEKSDDPEGQIGEIQPPGRRIEKFDSEHDFTSRFSRPDRFMAARELPISSGMPLGGIVQRAAHPAGR